MKESFKIAVLILILFSPIFLKATEPPITVSGESCGPGMVSLFAFGNDIGETVKWYHINSGGSPVFSEPVTSSGYMSQYDVYLLVTDTFWVSLDSAGVESIRIPVTGKIHNLPNDFSGDTTIIIDIEGNTYKTVRVGNQLWMKENLRVTHYRNGDPVPNIQNGSAWATQTHDAFCYWNNDSANYAANFGVLYNGYVVESPKQICPTGWHIPSRLEWNELANFLGGSNVAGGKMKESGIVHWNTPNTGATNLVGFNALPAGNRHGDNAAFAGRGEFSHWWTSTKVSSNQYYFKSIFYNSTVLGDVYERKVFGFAIRCIKDNNISKFIGSKDTLCSGQSSSVKIAYSQPGIKYQLKSDTLKINTAQFGNGDTLTFNIPKLNETTEFFFEATDTLTGCTIVMDTNFYININDRNSIYGKVTYNGDSLPLTGINLYNHLTNKLARKIDSFSADSTGSFVFTNINNGNYLLYAQPDTSAYPKVIGTYYKNADQWTKADIIQINGCKANYKGVNIEIQEFFTNPPGNGIIKGKLTGSYKRSQNKPIKDVEVTLQKVPPIRAVKKVLSDSNGFYEFDKLSDGNYRILIDIPGLQMDSAISVTISSKDSIFEGNDYIIDSNGIKVDKHLGFKRNNSIKSKLFIYPNPTSGILCMDILSNTNCLYSLELIDFTGRLILIDKFFVNGQSLKKIDLSMLNKGIYFMILRSDREVKNVRIILQ
jgi:uncharacterized protein (TIGR02145 family)